MTTLKQAKARMIDIHYKVLLHVREGKQLRDYYTYAARRHQWTGLERAASTLIHWEAITAGALNGPHEITPVGEFLINHWEQKHAI